MIRLPNLTSAAHLDHVQALLLRTARGRHGLPARAYLAEEPGRVTLVYLPRWTARPTMPRPARCSAR